MDPRSGKSGEADPAAHAKPAGQGPPTYSWAMASELMLVLILLCVVVVPIAAVAFARSGKAYDEIGKGRFAVDFDQSSEAEHHEEVRQADGKDDEDPVGLEEEAHSLSYRPRMP